MQPISWTCITAGGLLLKMLHAFHLLTTERDNGGTWMREWNKLWAETFHLLIYLNHNVKVFSSEWDLMCHGLRWGKKQKSNFYTDSTPMVWTKGWLLLRATVDFYHLPNHFMNIHWDKNGKWLNKTFSRRRIYLVFFSTMNSPISHVCVGHTLRTVSSLICQSEWWQPVLAAATSAFGFASLADWFQCKKHTTCPTFYCTHIVAAFSFDVFSPPLHVQFTQAC